MQDEDPEPDASPRAPDWRVQALEVRRTARVVSSGPLEGQHLGVWYALHGYAQLAPDFARACAPLAEDGRLLVAPEGLSRFYAEGGSGPVAASWMTREERAHEIADTLAYLEQLEACVDQGRDQRTPRGVLGFSQGAAAAARWVVLGGLRPARLVLWGAGLPPDLEREACRSAFAQVDVVLVAGTTDPFLRPERLGREWDRLREHAPAARLERFEGGHRLQRALLRTLAPLTNRARGAEGTDPGGAS